MDFHLSLVPSQAKNRGLPTTWNSWGAFLDFHGLRLGTAVSNWEAGWDLMLGTQVCVVLQLSVESTKVREMPLSIWSHWFLEEVTPLKRFNMSCVLHLQMKCINILVFIKTPFWKWDSLQAWPGASFVLNWKRSLVLLCPDSPAAFSRLLWHQAPLSSSFSPENL